LKLIFLKWVSVFALLFLLSACHTVPKQGETSDHEGWESDSAFFYEGYKQHQALTQWQYRAKVGVVTPDESQQANMVWVYDNNANTVRLFGPLGVGAIKIEFDEHGVVLSDRKGELHRGDSAQYLLESIVGWSIPVDALQYWLFSLPLPNLEQAYRYQVDDAQNVVKLQQLGWTIEYEDYKTYFNDGWPLARKVIATKQVAPEQTVTVKLITKSWK